MLSKLVRNFAAHEGGNYAVIFTLAALPLMAGVGMAFDYVEASDLQSRLAGSLSQAGLAGAQDMARGKPGPAVEKTVKAFLLANLGAEFADELMVSVKMPTPRSLEVSAKLQFKPLMAPVYAALTGNSSDHFDYVIEAR
jgi:Flp pilus assembly protein TadG